VRAFSGNDNVSFGDVDLSSGDAPMPRYTAEAGRGGWPTIRFVLKFHSILIRNISIFNVLTNINLRFVKDISTRKLV